MQLNITKDISLYSILRYVCKDIIYYSVVQHITGLITTPSINLLDGCWTLT